MKRILIRADGNERIGLGHIIRSLALAEMLKKDYHCVFAINNPDIAIIRQINETCQELIKLNENENVFLSKLNGDEIVVLDGYHFNPDLQQKIKEKGCSLICIDDLAKGYFIADAVINQNPAIRKNIYRTKAFTRIYSGLRYLLLRQPFMDAMAVPARNEKVDSLLIGMGGADPYNISFSILQNVLASKKKFKTIHIMLGSANSHAKQIMDFVVEKDMTNLVSIHRDISAKDVVDLIRMSDVSITPASGLALECCAVKTGLITGHYADNQLLLYDFLVKNRLAFPGGRFSPGKLKRQLLKITTEEINKLISRQSEIFAIGSCDILKVFKTIEKEDKLVISKAVLNDALLYFEWANDRVVREHSIHKESILWDEHIRWFNERINSGKSTLYLFKTDDNRPLGQLRFDHEGKQNWINFSSDENFRGQGWAAVLIKMAIQQLILEKPGIKEINAVVKPDNLPSIRAFEHNSFQLKRTYSVKGEKYLEFKKINHENRL